MAFRLPYLFVLLLLFVSDVDIYSNTSSIPRPVYNDTTIKNAFGNKEATYSSLFVYYYLMFD